MVPFSPVQHAVLSAGFGIEFGGCSDCHEADVSLEEIIIYKSAKLLGSFLDVSVLTCVIVSCKSHDVTHTAIVMQQTCQGGTYF